MIVTVLGSGFLMPAISVMGFLFTLQLRSQEITANG